MVHQAVVRMDVSAKPPTERETRFYDSLFGVEDKWMRCLKILAR